MFRNRLLSTGLALGLAALALPAPAALKFNFIAAPGTSRQAIDGFAAAGARWSSVFTDDVTVNVKIGFTSLSPDVLAHTDSAWSVQPWSRVRADLLADVSSPDDSLAAASLPGKSLNLLLNRTKVKGKTTLAPHLDKDRDANNRTIRLHTANAKALGLLPARSKRADGTIVFGSDFAWDFDPADGISPDAFDFVGLATHELGHTLGFVSGVDTLEALSKPLPDHRLTAVTPLDLFRYSTESRKAGRKTLDFTADARAKYFSIDAGKSSIAPFSTGALSDGNQASHWKADASAGLMAPLFDPGQRLTFSPADLRAFDVIGYDLDASFFSKPFFDDADSLFAAADHLPSVSLNALRIPEPTSLTFASIATLSLLRRQRRSAPL